MFESEWETGTFRNSISSEKEENKAKLLEEVGCMLSTTETEMILLI